MVRSIHNAEHYTRANNCDAWHLLKTNSLSVIQERKTAGEPQNQNHMVTGITLYKVCLKR